MAAEASHARIEMGAVVKVGIVGQQMDVRPGNGPQGTPAFTHRHQPAALRQDERMAVHAGLRRWQIGVGSGLDRMVAVAAIHGEIAGVQRMAEGERLLRPVADIGIPGRAEKRDKADRACDQQNNPEQECYRDLVRPALEELGQ